MQLLSANKYGLMVVVTILTIAYSCRKDKESTYAYLFPSYFPEMSVPQDNEPTELRIKLGRHLFFDPALSRDGTISCGSCHIPEKAFADGHAKAIGIEQREGIRNSPTLANIAYSTSFFMDGGVPTLELQVLAPIENHNEMDFDILSVASRLSSNENYNEWSREAYGRDLDPYVILRSIAAFERSMTSYNSRFDKYYYRGDKSAVSDAEVRGWNLFKSNRLSCSQCHPAPLFTDYNFYYVGLDTQDEGRWIISGNPEDKYKVKTPTLRNLSYTAPYMRDGRFDTLEEVIEHFNSGGVEQENKDPRIKKLELTQEEKNDIMAFLNSLNDESFLTREDLQNPFKQ